MFVGKICHYSCTHCGHRFSVYRNAEEMSETNCGKCAKKVSYVKDSATKSNIQFIGTRVEDAEYNPGLGCVTKSKRHREEIARQKGVVEIGNDYGSGQRMGDMFDKARAEKLRKSWDEV